MKVWIGNDHGGYELKRKLVEKLRELGHEAEDVGCHGTDIVRYPYYAARVAEAVSSGKAPRGIIVCSSGIGVSIAANKFPGVRASLCTTPLMAEMTRAHNDSNILCLGGKMLGEWDAMRILEVWMKTPYDGGRHDISLGLIAEIEKAQMNGEYWRPEGPEL